MKAASLGKARPVVQVGSKAVSSGRKKMGVDQTGANPRSFPPNAVHLVRTAQQINVSLSQMADQKASILMGATFVVFTITVGQASRIGPNPAILVLAFFAFLSAMLAVYAILPTVNPKAADNPNLLFFGHFTHMSEDEFVDGVLDHLGNDEITYRTMLRDIYQNGQVLQRKKYRFLGLAYKAFMAGLVITLGMLFAQWAGIGF
jgi:hypothetical protein